MRAKSSGSADQAVSDWETTSSSTSKTASGASQLAPVPIHEGSTETSSSSGFTSGFSSTVFERDSERIGAGAARSIVRSPSSALAPSGIPPSKRTSSKRGGAAGCFFGGAAKSSVSAAVTAAGSERPNSARLGSRASTLFAPPKPRSSRSGSLVRGTNRLGRNVAINATTPRKIGRRWPLSPLEIRTVCPKSPPCSASNEPKPPAMSASPKVVPAARRNGFNSATGLVSMKAHTPRAISIAENSMAGIVPKKEPRNSTGAMSISTFWFGACPPNAER